MAKKKKKKSSKKKKKKNSISKTNQKLLAKAEALKKITEHNRDYLSLNLTIPLGSSALKNVHTNQWLFTNLPKEFDLANWTIIANALNSSTNRYSGYIKNRWYIDGVDINVEVGGKAEMKLSLNAFASSIQGYVDNLKDMKKSYTSAKSKKTNKTGKSNKKSSKNKTKAVKKKNSKNTSLKGGEGKFIDDLVKKICGHETDDLKKAKLIHEHLRKKERYSYYECTKYSTPKKCYENIKHLNCADMSRLTASMMRSAGIDCYVVHSTCHFYTVLKIGGKLYCSDNASSNSTGRQFNYYWQGSSCHSGYTTKFKGKSSYYAKCGKVPSC